MKNFKLKLGLSLFILGLIGVFSLLSLPLPTSHIPEEVRNQFSENTLRWLFLINPTILLIPAVVLGSLLHEKVKLEVPTIGGLLGGKEVKEIFLTQLKWGLSAGIVAGLLLLLFEQTFYPFLPEEFIAFGESFKPGPLVRFLYGGITEEILMRYGLMTFLVWLLYKITKALKPWIYWIAILLSALLFALGHLPVAFQAVVSPSTPLLLYIIIGNTIGGIVYGWLYWKKGLESAIVAHVFTHLVFLAAAWIAEV